MSGLAGAERGGLLGAQEQDLAALAGRDRLRRLSPRTGVDFASNDYLGLAESGVLAQAAREALDRGVAVGSGGSRLLRGNHQDHEALEEEAARFFGSESALFLPTGYTANSALLATMPQRGDHIFADELIHASCHEGLRLTRAGHTLVAHGDAEAFDQAITAWRNQGGAEATGGRAWIAVESLYSMDGDIAPLSALLAVAERHDALLVVDEAHATGILGPGGRGLVAALPSRERIITLHTLGKALGCEGALLAGPRVMRDFLVNRARGFIFSTAPSPLNAAIGRASLKLCEQAEDLRADLRARIAQAEALLAPLGAQTHGTPIMPLILGTDKRAMAVANRLQQAGFDVRGIRPPTVPEGTARLRIVITRNAAPAQIEALAQALKEALA
ncbi:8-amino-7-oxononanoate synthase [Novosphingobium rosa]|uniref:8-amino-7-oxononanoate synthase n=1 Tax=Novosphingobium rosa TaxID=76978 RepID=UPI0008350152|nr:8-amino-7-oxononanoate synthase [Novosphingobium rosa]